MSRLELASDRLRAALEGLERAVAARPPAGDETTHLQGRIVELEAERGRLVEKVAALEEELAAQAGLTEDVENRLDGAIGEIRAALART
ncbi:MAG: DUF4164 family protein [Alphaproteobacteria bacterium]|nr:DUF4164 family protein [Alphaproteobacteria bacterium]